ncbi:MAG: glycerol-3-phosphate 1-O-acyltransferase PlsY [Synergistales bacterium]|nr:glycerol-3-phosphate 1-O-acyltransferase PlsY [Synergistales bacterium]
MSHSILLILLGYLLGSMPWGYLIFRLIKGDDIRNYGSGNIGATNVGRFLGKKWAVLVAVADMFKGSVGLIVAYISGVRDPWIISIIGIAAVLGHNFPVWLGFKGGKGVSTTYGVVIFYFPPLSFVVAALGGITWFIVLKLSRYVSVASLLSLFSLPLWCFAFKLNPAYFLACLFLAVLSSWRHRSNLLNIRAGTERKIGEG